MSDYPDNWDKIALAVKRAAGWRCEHCGHAHDIDTGHVLTVHHLDMDTSNCDPDNLVALCQRCHLSIQARYHLGQQWLAGFEPDWATKRGLVLDPPTP